MGINDFGATADTLAGPELAAWAASVASVLENDATISARLTAKADTSHTHTSSQVTDWTEAVQDVVGALFTAAGGSYNDGANTVAFPATAAALKFAAGAIMLHPGITSTSSVQYRWISAMPAFVTTSSRFACKGANEPLMAPIAITKTIVVDQLAIKVNTAVAASTCRVGLFNVDSLGRPTTLVTNVDTGSISTATTGVKAVSITATSIPPGDYAIVSTANDTTMQVEGWDYPNWVLAQSVAAADTAAFGAQYGHASTATAFSTNLSAVTWSRDDASGRGLPVLQMHLTGAPT